jgi:transcriptional regulator with XRE-family HTH domain
MSPAKRANNPRASGAHDVQVGNRIRISRIAKNISQDELGQKLGVSFQQIQKYEKGVNRIAGEKVLQISGLLGIDPNYLLGWDKDSFRIQEQVSGEAMKMALRFESLHPDLRSPIQRMLNGMAEAGFIKPEEEISSGTKPVVSEIPVRKTQARKSK